MKISELQKQTDKKIAILGFGKEGKSSLAFLEKLELPQENIVIFDQNEIHINGYTSISGENYLDTIDQFDIIFKTPGISPYNPKLINIRDRFTSGAQIFFDNYKGKIIGVTATKGKSTTSTLIHKTLEHSGKDVKLVGNIGNPVLEEVDLLNDETHEFIVYELSSYMLEGLQPHCFIGIFGNLYPCHLDWHNDDFEVYKQAKLNLLKYAKNSIINSDFLEYDQNLSNKSYISGEKGDFYFDDQYFYTGKEKVFGTKGILLKGDHNKKNICSVIGVCNIIESTEDTLKKGSLYISLQEVLSKFSGLPHRLENIGTYNGITFIDDGISTTPESTIEAIKTFAPNIGTILVGGQDSGFTDESIELLKNKIVEHSIQNIVLFPDTGNRIFGKTSHNMKIGEVIQLELGGVTYNLYKTDNMKDAIHYTYNNTHSGEIALLSNAAPSFSIWKNYIEKGKLFKQEIIKQAR